MVKLTIKQQRFCDEYLIDLNATQAAIRAGYSKKTARQTAAENMAKHDIKNYIGERMAEKESSLIAKQDEILQFLTQVLRGDAEGMALVGIGKGAQEVEQVQPTVTEKTKAAELLGKRYAMWTDKQIIDGVQQAVINNDLKD